jgi:hypothetical protein
MSLGVDGVWKAGVWATTVWANGVWREGAYVPVVSSSSGASSGGLMGWDGKRIASKRLYFHDSDARPVLIEDKEVELIKKAQDVISRVKASPNEGLAEVTEISGRLKTEIDSLHAQVADYQAKLDKQASFSEFSAKLEAQNAARALEYLMINAEIKAEIMQRQVEEIDVVFVIMALLAT